MEEELKKSLIGKRISSMKLFHVETWPIEWIPKTRWLVCGGIEIDFGENKFVYGWHSDIEYNSGSMNSFEDIYHQDNYWLIDQTEYPQLIDLAGSVITDADIHVAQEETFEGWGNKMVLEAHLKLDNQLTIHLASVETEIENGKKCKPTYSLIGDAMISIGNVKIDYS